MLYGVRHMIIHKVTEQKVDREILRGWVGRLDGAVFTAVEL